MTDYNQHKRAGFTLVELVVIIALMSILIAVAIPSVKSVFKASNISSDEASAKYMETALMSIYKATLTGDSNKGNYYIYDFTRIQSTTTKELFKKILLNGTGESGGDSAKDSSGYGSVKVNKFSEAFYGSTNCFLGKNDLPFFCIYKAQGIEKCSIFFGISYSENDDVLKCRDTNGNTYTVSGTDGSNFIATSEADTSVKITLTYLDSTKTLGDYFDFKYMTGGE